MDITGQECYFLAQNFNKRKEIALWTSDLDRPPLGGGIALNPMEDQDLPDKLPSPQALTIIGSAGNDTYDGSVAKTVSAGMLGAVGTIAKNLTVNDDILRLPCGTYVYEGIIPAGKNYPTTLVGNFVHLIISVIGTSGDIPGVGKGYSFVLAYSTYGALYINGYNWGSPGTWYVMSGAQA